MSRFQRRTSSLYKGARRLFVALYGFIITVPASLPCFFRGVLLLRTHSYADPEYRIKNCVNSGGGESSAFMGDVSVKAVERESVNHLHTASYLCVSVSMCLCLLYD